MAITEAVIRCVQKAFPGKARAASQCPRLATRLPGFSSGVLLNRGDRFFECVDCHVGFILSDDQWRRDSYCAWTGAQEENAALKRLFDDAVAIFSAVLFRLLIFNDVDANHQAAA